MLGSLPAVQQLVWLSLLLHSLIPVVELGWELAARETRVTSTQIKIIRVTHWVKVYFLIIIVLMYKHHPNFHKNHNFFEVDFFSLSDWYIMPKTAKQLSWMNACFDDKTTHLIRHLQFNKTFTVAMKKEQLLKESFKLFFFSKLFKGEPEALQTPKHYSLCCAFKCLFRVWTSVQFVGHSNRYLDWVL